MSRKTVARLLMLAEPHATASEPPWVAQSSGLPGETADWRAWCDEVEELASSGAGAVQDITTQPVKLSLPAESARRAVLIECSRA